MHMPVARHSGTGNTHAILDGMHRRFETPTNRDVLALHEGFADIVALMQHPTMPEILGHHIRVRAVIWRAKTFWAA